MQDTPHAAVSAASRPWLSSYPEGVPTDVDASVYPTLVDMIESSYRKNADKPFLTSVKSTITFGDVDRKSRDLAGYFQTLGLKKGDRVAVMAPNIFQQPIAVHAALRAGFVVVNVNPLYTARELKHQLSDSGAKAIVIMENFASTLQEVLPETPIEHIVVTSLGDQLPKVKGAVINFMLRHVKKMVPGYKLPTAVKFNKALKIGAAAGYTRPELKPDDLAILQYTGGTTGVAKGAMLHHKTLVSALLSAIEWFRPGIADLKEGEQPTAVCALPLYHVFALVNVHFLALVTGGRLILIANPRDVPTMSKFLKGEKFQMFPGVNTLFTAMSRDPVFRSLDFSRMMLSIGGGAAVLEATAKEWKEVTGVTITQGYGLSETSSGICCMPANMKEYTGSVGVPIPGIEMRILDDQGREMPVGERGEMCIRGPAVMSGYWNRPEATKESFTADGFFRTGDIGVMDEKGFFRIVDRKKDMILVSGFNVYPNEVEDVITGMPGVLECAAIGVPDDATGEAIRLYVVLEPGADIDAAAIRAYAKTNMVAYKCPKQIVFADELPKSLIGKILRRELREKAIAELKS